MANGTVAIKFKFDGAEKFHTLELDLENISGALKNVNENARTLDTKIVNLASKTQLLESLDSVVQQLNGVFNDLTSAYQDQQVAETKLAQAMRNTMGASNAEIESIKQLCSEQQKLGVIGDEVQLAASQELATYLTMSDNLKTLIPVMNDMVAQQYGLGASAESATQIASMLGKVMNGQTEALSRYGYKFDEAQKRILLYGTESERAAVLAQVVSEAVGGMNERLAQTPSGQMQQLRNRIGDVKESLGEAIQPLMKIMTFLSSATTVVAGWGRLRAAIDAFAKSTKIAKAEAQGLSATSTVQAASQKLANTSIWAGVFGTKSLTAATIALKVAIGALYLIIAAVAAAIVGGLAYALGFWGNKSNELAQTQSELASRVKDEIGELDELKGKIDSTTASQTERQQAIKTFNEKYGEYAGKLLDEKSKVNEVAEAYRKAKMAIVDKVAAEMKSEYVSKSKEKENKATRELIDTIGGLTDSNGYKLNSKAQGELYQYIMQKSNGNRAWDSRDILKSVRNHFKGGVLGNSGADLSKLGNAIHILQEKQEDTLKQEDEYDAFMKGYTDSLKKTLASDDSKTSGESFKEWFDSKKKDYQEAVKAYNKAKKTGTREEVDIAQKTMDDLGKQLKDYGYNPETGKKMTSAEVQAHIKETYESSLNESLKASERKREEELSSVRIDAMEEGKDKERAALDQQHKEEEADLKVWYDQMIKKDQEYQKNLYKEKHGGSLKGFQYDNNTESNTHLAKIEEEATARALAILQKFNEKQAILDKKSNEQAEKDRVEYLSQYGDYQARKAAINDKYNKLIDQAENEWQKKALERERDKALGKTYVTTQETIVDMQAETSQLNGLEGKSLKMKLELIGLDGVAQKIREIQQMMNDPSATEDQKKALKKLQDEYIGYYKQLLRTDKGLIQTWGSVKGLRNSIEGMTEAIKGQGNAWKKISGIIDSTISLYQSISQIIEIVKMLTGVTKEHTVAKQAEGAQSLTTAGQEATGAGIEAGASKLVQNEKKKETGTSIAATIANLFSAHSAIPFVGYAIAGAMAVAFLALMAGLPKFADGGIAYGPTLGLFGEYSGASHNPEVVAPLDKLKGMLNEPAGFGGKVTFRIEGRNLVGVLGKESHYRSRR